jgi:hypothetical protein
MKNGKLQAQLQKVLKKFLKLRVPLFLLLIVIVYAYVALRASALANANPSASAIADQTKASATPHIDQATVNKIQQLQDNSVTVRTLFNQARQNPFQE